MQDITELLKCIIAQETKYVESIRNSLKESELTILRLQNKSRSLEKESEERKQLIKECRGCLREILETAQTKKKLVTSIKQQMDIDPSTRQVIKLVKSLEKHA
jgi:lipopolysaccharide biosynthesis regulator YciM